MTTTLQHSSAQSKASRLVFISYARKDGADCAAQLDIALVERGFSTWRDTRNIDPAQDFTAELEHAILDGRLRGYLHHRRRPASQ